MLRFRRLALALVLAATSAFLTLAAPAPAHASPTEAKWTYFDYYDDDGHGVLAYRLYHDPYVASKVGIQVAIWQNNALLTAKGAVLSVYHDTENGCGKYLKFKVHFEKYVGNGHYATVPFWGDLPVNPHCQGWGWYYDVDGEYHEWHVSPYGATQE